MKFLDDILLEQTSSTPNIPSDNNFGILYASASAVYYRNTNSNFKLGYPTSGINILYFTGSNQGIGTTQTYTYTVPNNVQIIDVVCVGAGGGGGAGVRSTAATIGAGSARSGGYGGAGGSIVCARFHVSELVPGSNYTVTVPPGGAGGAPTSATGVRGNNGQDGGSTSFGTRVIATGGQGGLGGQGATAAQNRATSSIATCVPPIALYAIPATGAGRIVNTGAVTTSALEMMANSLNLTVNNTTGGAGSGGAGGGHAIAINSPNPASSGSNARDILNNLILNNSNGNPGISTLTGPGGNGGNGTDKLLTTFLNASSSVDLDLTYGLGGGGHGGGYPTGSGGHGGLYGAGGGGGGSAFFAIPASRPGGSGSSGLCIVVEYL